MVGAELRLGDLAGDFDDGLGIVIITDRKTMVGTAAVVEAVYSVVTELGDSTSWGRLACLWRRRRICRPSYRCFWRCRRRHRRPLQAARDLELGDDRDGGAVGFGRAQGLEFSGH